MKTLLSFFTGFFLTLGVIAYIMLSAFLVSVGAFLIGFFGTIGYQYALNYLGM